MDPTRDAPERVQRTMQPGKLCVMFFGPAVNKVRLCPAVVQYQAQWRTWTKTVPSGCCSYTPHRAALPCDCGFLHCQPRLVY